MENAWNHIQYGIEACLECDRQKFDEVLCKRAKKHPVEPSNVKILFISEAPPASGAYFYDETRPDGLRDKLFLRLNEIGVKVETIQDFLDHGFFLVPTVKCPSGKPKPDGRSMNNKNPRSSVIRLCVERHLAREIEFMKPQLIILLGGVTLMGCSRILSGLHRESVELAREKSPIIAQLRKLAFEIYPTYWPTQRHGHIEDMKADFRKALSRLSYGPNHHINTG